MNVSFQKYPLIIVKPDESSALFPTNITTIQAAMEWLNNTFQSSPNGKYSIAFLADGEFVLNLVSFSKYADNNWGTSRIELLKFSPFIEPNMTNEDIYRFIDHIISVLPTPIKEILVGEADENVLNRLTCPEKGLALYLLSNGGEIVATLDLYWGVRDLNDNQITCNLPYFSNSSIYAIDGEIFIPAVNDAKFILENLRVRLNLI